MKWILSILKALGPFMLALLKSVVKGVLQSEERAKQAELERQELIKSQALQSEREKQHVKVIEEIYSDDLSPERVHELLSTDLSKDIYNKGREAGSAEGKKI